MTEYDKLIDIIDRYDTVSFDILDTLLLRNVQHPVDIFAILEKKIEGKYNIPNFKNTRIEAEIKSRTPGNNYECSLDEIYESFPITDTKVLEDIKRMEIKLEEEFIMANPFMKKIYNYCLEKGKKIIAITDMYLPLNVIKRLLSICGYDNVNVYLSCYYRKHKGNGTLFEFVYREEKIEKNSWLHIGDNYNSDYLQAINFGISAYHYRSVFERSDIKDEASTISESIIFAIRNNMVNNGLAIPYWKKFAILYAVPIYFGFANWIYEQNKDHDNIYFLARDGYFIKKIFDLIAKRNKNKISSRYLYTSRRAIQLPTAFFEDKTTAIDTISCINTELNEKLELDKVFKYFDLDINNYNDIIKKYKFNLDENEIYSEDYIKYKQLISEVYDDFKVAMKKKVALTKKYLKQEKLFDYKRVNVVDIGWRGSIQYALSQLTDNDIFGYYFATSYVYNEIYYNTNAYIMNYCNPTDLSEEIFPNIGLYEFLFSAPEGSLVGFKEINGKIIPILKENNDYGKEIKVIQDEALKAIDTILKYYEYLDDYSPLQSIIPYRRFIKEKKYSDLIMFAHLKIDVGYSSQSVTFVPTFSKEQIINNKDIILEESNKSIWNKTFIIDGIRSEEEYQSFIKKIYNNKASIISFDNLIKAIRHPLKAFKKIIKIILKIN